jgi:hypothetical protein
MNAIEHYLETREQRAADTAEADTRWQRERGGIDPAERLQKWDAWLRKTLAETLKWPASKPAATRLQCQCANEMTTMAKQLRGRGWLLDGDALAQHVRACLKPIAEQQRAGKVEDFWPYFRASVRRYVGGNAEEIQLHARRTGADEAAQSMNAIMAALNLGNAVKPKPESLTELITRRAAETSPKPLRRPIKKPACPPDAPRLPGL